MSRAIGQEKLFRQETNYEFFISRYHKYISPIADTYCYSLLPNHFHFLIRIKAEAAIRTYYEQLKCKEFTAEIAPDFIMQCFSNLLNSYAKSYNGKYHRKGSLFIDYLRRVVVKNDSQFGATIFYIHKNPVHHGYCDKMEHWRWSSFNAMLSDKPTALLRQEVLDLFGGRKGFLQYHNQPIYLKDAADLE